MVVIHGLKGGGSERVLLNMLKGLDRSEFVVTLVLYERVFDFPLPEDVTVKVLDISASRNIVKLAAGFLMKIMKVARLIRTEGPDVVFSLLSSTNAAAIIAGWVSGRKCRVIVSEHTHPTLNLGNERFGAITRRFIKFLYPRSEKIVAVSGGIKDDLVKNLKIPERKITVIHNPIDLREIRELSVEDVDHPFFSGDVPVIVSSGRLTKQKGYPYLIRAFSLAKKSLACRLVILGEGEDREKLQGMTKDLGLANDVLFLGFQENPFKYMARSSLFVLSSLYEGFGNVLVEAMALGLPVISTDCPSGPSEIIEDGRSGLLVPVKDEQALAAAIIEVLSDESLRSRLSGEARLRAGSFSLEKINEKYRSLFSENTPSSL